MNSISSVKYKNLDQTKSFQKLQKEVLSIPNLKESLTPARIAEYKITNGPLTFSYASSLVNDRILNKLQQLADEQQVIAKYNDLLAGKIMNPSENRMVLHQKTRSSQFRGDYQIEQNKIADFAQKVHSGEIRGATGKKITDVVQIGIGGSDLGPRMCYKALQRYVKDQKGQLPLRAHFISNVDSDDANWVLDKIDPEKTLFIVVSKSGTTQETLTNQEFVKIKSKIKGLKAEDVDKHFIAVTGNNPQNPMNNPSKFRAIFYMDDHIGGRYSSTSAVGGAVLSLAFGPDIFERFLQGANKIDESAKNPNIRQNMPLLDALIGVWERNVLGLPIKAIIPYSKALNRFSAHLQQLDSESNGKSVNRYSQPLNYHTDPMVFGEPGTDGQHSFFQKLHQGTDIIPIEFIGFSKPQISQDIQTFGSYSQEKLIANLIAQITALAQGKTAKNLNDHFQGNRPTSLIMAEQLTPEALGALLAHFENKVMFQGFLWNLNSFDQPGVQLGKKLAIEALNKSDNKNPILTAYQNLFIKNK